MRRRIEKYRRVEPGSGAYWILCLLQRRFLRQETFRSGGDWKPDESSRLNPHSSCRATTLSGSSFKKEQRVTRSHWGITGRSRGLNPGAGLDASRVPCSTYLARLKTRLSKPGSVSSIIRTSLRLAGSPETATRDFPLKGNSFRNPSKAERRISKLQNSSESC